MKQYRDNRTNRNKQERVSNSVCVITRLLAHMAIYLVSRKGFLKFLPFQMKLGHHRSTDHDRVALSQSNVICMRRNKKEY